ncbi:MAG: tyrosine-type recombinase/integrase [Gammaproteobacteria bacterium]|nr:tyrosine-type recombinase/integrase [Gammaproteobacteria bacterium]
MKPTDFSVHMTGFLTHHLAAQRNLSPNTVRTYRDAFTLLLRFCRDQRGIALERLCLKHVDVPLVEAFLDHLEAERQVSIPTLNNRLAALHSFFRYVQSEVPDHLLQCQRILAIPLRRQTRAIVGYLSKEDLARILAQPDLRRRAGRRDAVLLSVLYDTGARVQELIDLSAGDVRLDPPAQIRLFGKGRKMRAVPLMEATSRILGDYLHENGLQRPEKSEEPVFQNRRGGRLSRWGVRYILDKHVRAVRDADPGFRQPVTPHTLRHTKGMHLLQAGVSLEIIRDFLGHEGVTTTQIYARANLEMKRKALAKVADPDGFPEVPSWQRDQNLLDWLHSL